MIFACSIFVRFEMDNRLDLRLSLGETRDLSIMLHSRMNGQSRTGHNSNILTILTPM
jgi:hypothetical protein